MRTTVLFIIVIVVIASSCQKPLKNGVVVEKWYEDATITKTYLPQGPLDQRTVLPRPVLHSIYDGEDWCIKVACITNNGDTIINTYFVDSCKYNNISAGDSVLVSNLSLKDLSLNDITYKK